MITQIRRGVFETNSSSTHCLTVKKGQRTIQIKPKRNERLFLQKMVANYGEYGWGYDELRTVQEKVSYLITYWYVTKIDYLDEFDILIEKLQDLFWEHGYELLIDSSNREECYIDHQSIGELDYLITDGYYDFHKIEMILFDDSVILLITNDNSELEWVKEREVIIGIDNDGRIETVSYDYD